MESKEMKYERLICRIWNTNNRMSDPFGLADTGLYEREINKLGDNLLFSLEAAFRKMAYTYAQPYDKEEYRVFFKMQLENFYNIKNQDDVENLIDKTLEFIEVNNVNTFKE